mmetsp:Transcript_5635/g.20179  ORF Transcript_5635/g.20179 Transcript_5635/m.20179 type:complete len:201 (-) Transcript_5635:49-651(-)
MTPATLEPRKTLKTLKRKSFSIKPASTAEREKAPSATVSAVSSVGSSAMKTTSASVGRKPSRKPSSTGLESMMSNSQGACFAISLSVVSDDTKDTGTYHRNTSAPTAAATSAPRRCRCASVSDSDRHSRSRGSGAGSRSGRPRARAMGTACAARLRSAREENATRALVVSEPLPVVATTLPMALTLALTPPLMALLTESA